MKLKYLYRNNKEAINNTFIFLCLIPTYFIIPYGSQYLGEVAFWITLSLTALIGVYFIVTFFSAKDKFEKIYYLFATLIYLIFYFALVYKAVGAIDTDTGELVKVNWIEAIYLSFSTWTTLGYSDFRPPDNLKVLVIIETILGYVFMGLFVAKVVVYLQSVSNNLSAKKDKVKEPTLSQRKRRIFYSKKR